MNIIFKIIAGIIVGILFFFVSVMFHNLISEDAVVEAMHQPIIIWFFGLFGCGVGYKYSTGFYELMLEGFGSFF